MRFTVRVVDTTYDIYEVEAENEEEALEIAAEIHCDGGPGTEAHQGGGCDERQVEVLHE